MSEAFDPGDQWYVCDSNHPWCHEVTITANAESTLREMESATQLASGSGSDQQAGPQSSKRRMSVDETEDDGDSKRHCAFSASVASVGESANQEQS